MSPSDLSVLMVTPFSPLQAGGVQRYVWEVSTRLQEQGVHVEIACSDPTGTLPGVEQRDGLTIHTVPAHPRDRDWCFAPGLWPAMARRSWDVVHVQSYHTLVAPLAMLRALHLRTPYCVTFHGGGHTSEVRNRARPMQRRLLSPLLARAAALVAVARFEVDVYGTALGIAAERFRVIPVGTDLKLPDDPAGEPDGRARARDPVLASIGRLEHYKGHHRVIDALPHVLRVQPEARLLIVGTGPYRDALEARVRELGLGDRVELTSVPPGDTDGMARLLSQVSLVVMMSDFETHPQVALEAAAARCRLLVADDGAGLREIAEDGLARPIALDASPEELALAIGEELVKPPPTVRPRLSSWNECVTRLHELYEEIRAGSGAPGS